MAGLVPVVVGSLDEALARQDQYESAISFQIAVPSTKTGGQRSWLILKVKKEEDGDTAIGWVREAEEDTIFPALDNSAADLPELPPSKLGWWELRFVDGDGALSPRIRIDPSVATSKRTKPDEASPVSAKTVPEPANPPPTSEKSLILQALQMQIAATKEANQQSQALLTAVTNSIDKISAGHAQVQAVIQAEMLRSHKMAADAEKTRDAALGANILLQNQLAEARETSQGWITIQELYKGDPKLLHEGVRELVGGVIAAFRTAANT